MNDLDLLTRRPARLRAVRDSMPAPTVLVTMQSGGSRRGLWIGIGAALVAVAVVVGTLVAIGWLGGRGRGPSFALRDRTRLTFSGAVFTTAISADGEQLASLTHSCRGGGCSYAIDLQDVGGTGSRRVLDGATAAYGLEWSPDHRNLIFVGTWNGRWGWYLVPALGGEPRYLTSGAATFWAGGDSLLVGPPVTGGDPVFQVKVTSIDGTVRDSIAVTGPGLGLTALSVSPGGKWIAALVVRAGRGQWQVLDRNGKVADRVSNTCTCPGRITTDALWLTRAGTGSQSIVRIGLDPSTGRLSTRQDTLFSGTFNNFSVTGDGSTLVLDDGTREFALWALGLPEALQGRFSEDKRLAKTPSRFAARLSPDGNRILLGRNLPTPSGQSERRFVVLPFAGGSETPLRVQGTPRLALWTDSVTVGVMSQMGRGVHIGLVDVRTGGTVRTFDIPDSLVRDFAPLPDGWAWIPATTDRVMVERNGRTTEIPRLPWFGAVVAVTADATGRMAYFGWNAGTYDSVGVAVIPADGGPPVLWAASAAEGADARFLGDGSILFAPRDTPESSTLYRVRGPGRIERIGSVPRQTVSVTLSDDLHRAAVLETSYHGDAYLSRIVRP